MLYADFLNTEANLLNLIHNGNSFAIDRRSIFWPLHCVLRSLIKYHCMHLVLEDADSNDRVECRHCHWQGTINELKEGDYLLLSNITEVFCPHCKKYLGFIQHSSPPEKDK